MTLTFCEITLADVEALMPIENDCHSHPWSKNTFTSCIGGRYFGQLCQHKNDIIGFYIGEFVADEATLMDICIKPDSQGQGFVKSLLHAFFTEAKVRGATKIWLEVRAKNIAAQMMYINQGFTETGRRTGYYPSAKGFGYEDAIVMCKKL